MLLSTHGLAGARFLRRGTVEVLYPRASTEGKVMTERRRILPLRLAAGAPETGFRPAEKRGK